MQQLEHLGFEVAEIRAALALERDERAQLAARLGQALADLERLKSTRGLLHRAFRWGRQLAYNITIYFGCRLQMQALGDMRAGGSENGVTEWEMTDCDPRMLLRPRGNLSFPSGRYRIRFRHLQPLSALVGPRLYIDTGRDFNESNAQQLRLVGSGSPGAAAHVILPSGALALRFDPSSKGGWIKLGPVHMRRLTVLEYYWRLAVIAWKEGAASSVCQKPLQLVRTEGLSGIARRLRDLHTTGLHRAASYEQWIEHHDAHTVEGIQQKLAGLSARPLISVVMPVYNTPEHLLREAIESVRKQLYDNWELCIADDRSSAPHIRRLLSNYAATDRRIKLHFRESNGHISEATNSAFALSRGDWIALLDHDDLLPCHALAAVALELAAHPDAELVYSDEDKIDDRGRRYQPHFKSQFSRELFRSQNYLNHLTVHRAANIRAVGGWRAGFEGSQDYDLNLRIIERIDPKKIRHIPEVLYHWRAVSGSTATAASEKSYAFAAGLRALEEHIERMNLPASASGAPKFPFYRLQYRLPEPQPLVSLVIPTRDKVGFLRDCIASIVEKTTYANYEIIVVDNGSSERETLAYLEAVERRSWARVLRYDKPFNYSAINNFAVESARGSVVGLINNDVEVISPEWLNEMVSWAVQPDIGCVGAKLYYANDTIQHGGVILGVGGVANHAHLNLPRADCGYFGRAVVVSNFSAVTAACLVVRKDVYQKVGGFNERDLTVTFNDVDFCLKVRQAGYHNVWTPYAELYHYESISRGREDTDEKHQRLAQEVRYMQQTWAAELTQDPYYSMHFSKATPFFELAAASHAR